MAHAELSPDGGRIILTTEYRERELVKMIPGTRWDTSTSTWSAPLSWATCVAARGVFRDLLTVGPSLGEWSRSERNERIDPALALREAHDATGFSDSLYPFQRAGAAFLVVAGQALMADEMGTGKTIQTIAALEYNHGYPALIVCPNSMTFTWEVELNRWAPSVKTFVLTSGIATRRKALAQATESIEAGEPVAVIVNWEGVRKLSRLSGFGSIRLSDEDKEPKELNAVEWVSVVADEAHRAKDPTAQQTRAVWAVAHQPSVRHRYALTGTPIANSPIDLWSLMHYVAPHEWPAKTKFIDRYCLQSWGNWGGLDVVGLKSETREELFRFLDPRFIRRTKEAVLPQLPPKTYTTRAIDLQQKQRRAYDQLRKYMLAELDSGVLIASHPLQRLTRLLQFASAYGELDAETGDLTLTNPSCKVDALLEILEELGGKSVVVFAESRQLIELCAAELGKLRKGRPEYTFGLLTGAVTPADRMESVDKFQQGELQVLLATLGAGGEGLTLTAADTAVFLQRSFSAVKNAQAEDRIHRIGQDRGVTIIDVVARDTVESRVREIMFDKEAKLEEVVRDEEAVRRWLS